MDEDEAEMYKTFLNRKVVIIMKDGFKKFGTITNTNHTFIEILYAGGNKELIAMDRIAILKNDPKQ